VRRKARLRLRSRFRLRFTTCLGFSLNLNFGLIAIVVAMGRKDQVDSFPFTHQPESIRLDLFSVPVEGQEPEKALQLHPDHLGQRIPLASAFSVLDGITKNIVVFFFHYVYSILFIGGIQREAPACLLYFSSSRRKVA
jgi:hypothetical protein